MAMRHGQISPELSFQRYKCNICGVKPALLQSLDAFQAHLRDFHCSKEGGSFICRYGPNGVCRTLPIEGVRECDYVDHTLKQHAPESLSSPKKHMKRRVDSSSDESARRLSISSNASLDSLPAGRPWSLLQARINIPALLNDPGLGKRKSNFFTRTWGLEFETCPKLHYSPVPIITREDFQKYFQRVSTKLKQRKKVTQPTSQTLAPIDAFPPLYTLAQDKAQNELGKVPKIYSQPGFSLHDIATFSEALPSSQIQPTSQSDKLLQEQLSHYLDIVEVEISRQVALRSDAFFQVMTSHKELHTRLSSTLRAVKLFRLKMKRLDDILDVGPLTAIALKRKQRNCALVLKKLRWMDTIRDAQATVQTHLGQSDYVGALDLIKTTQDVLRKELGGVTAFRHFSSQLSELTRLIDTMMQDDFTRAIGSFLNHPIGESDSQDRLGLLARNRDSHTEEEDKLTAIVLGMIRQENFVFINLLKAEATTAIKAVVKQTAASVISARAGEDTDGKLGDQLRLLNFTQWTETTQSIFDSLVITLKRVKVLCDVIYKVLTGAAGLKNASADISLSRGVTTESRNQDSKNGLHSSAPICTGADPHSSSQNGLNYSLRPPTSENSGVSPLTNGVVESHTGLVECGGESSVSPFGDILTDRDDNATSGDPESGVTTVEDDEEEEEDNCRVERAVSFTMSEHELSNIITVTTARQIQDQLAEIMRVMADCAHDRVSKVFNAKAKGEFMGRLSSAQFTDMALKAGEFTSRCEAVCGRKSIILQGFIQSQASKFVARFHEEKKKTLSGVLETERWKTADVSTDFQKLILHIEASNSFSPPQSTSLSKTDGTSHSYIKIGGQQYVIVGSVLVLLRLLIEYCQCVECIPYISGDMLNRVTEVLKVFNSRTSQLILGAGALEVAGLKTISTKNLALLSRSLQLVEAYIPIVKAHFAAHLPNSKRGQLRYFDQLQKEYSEHNGVVLKKLTEIMDQMLDASLKQYEVKAPVPSNAFRMISKQLNKFHEAISDVLPESHVRSLFMKVNTIFKEKLRRQLQILRIHKSSGPLHGLVTTELAFYQQNFNSLRGLTNANISASLKGVWT